MWQITLPSFKSLQNKTHVLLENDRAELRKSDLDPEMGGGGAATLRPCALHLLPQPDPGYMPSPSPETPGCSLSPAGNRHMALDQRPGEARSLSPSV